MTWTCSDLYLLQRGVSMLRGKASTQLQTEVSALTRYALSHLIQYNIIYVYSCTRYRHPNLVPLMGYCEDPPCLVYPLMQRYSLFKNLHDTDYLEVYHLINNDETGRVQSYFRFTRH